jgi:hypothetical protein
VEFAPHCGIFQAFGNSRLCLATATHQRAAEPIAGSDIGQSTLKTPPEKALKNKVKKPTRGRVKISSRRAPRHD